MNISYWMENCSLGIVGRLTPPLSIVPRRQGQHEIIPKKNAEKRNKFIKYFVEINKNEVNKKTKGNVQPLEKINVSY